MPYRGRPPFVTPMEPGERNRYVTIQQATDTTGATGYPTETWTLLATFFAARYDQTGLERWKAEQEEGTQIVRWELPFVASMDPESVNVVKNRRVIYNGMVFDILASSLIGMREGIELITRVKVA
jgi:head-tail adaptor